MPPALLQELRNLDSSKKSLRSFGLVLGGVVTLVAGWLIWRSGSLEWSMDGRLRPSVLLGIVGIGVLAISVVLPQSLRPLYYVWMAIAFILGAVMTRVILTIVFVLLIIPTGLIMKILGRDALNRRIDASKSSYWISREDMDRTPERLEKYY